jgi:hypothetical protein
MEGLKFGKRYKCSLKKIVYINEIIQECCFLVE